MLETPTRPRGAQPGNQNARTHGFYTCNLDDLQENTIEQAKRASGIDDEIAIVRVKLRNVLEKDPDNARLAAQLATTIGHLLRVRLKLGEAVRPGLQEGIDEVVFQGADGIELSVVIEREGFEFSRIFAGESNGGGSNPPTEASGTIRDRGRRR